MLTVLHRGTLIDYTLDQLFIHLDDSNPGVHEAVLRGITEAALNVDSGLVRRKAESNRHSHRSPHLCDKILVAADHVNTERMSA